jgi:3-phosphoshikimate 1-carboxyvinyltransferase
VNVAAGDVLVAEPAASLAGDLVPPGDKSVSHRAVLVGMLADGPVEITGFGANEDTLATVAAAEAMGVRVERLDEVASHLRVHGVGMRGLRAPTAPIDVRNSGTLLRLLAGIVAGQSGTFTLDGDASIRRRPVDRIAVPLRLMGAACDDSEGLPPLVVRGGRTLQPIRYEMPMASAQVKSCILLAGLYAADGPTVVVESRTTRDHTERILLAAGVRVTSRQGEISVWPAQTIALDRVEVPTDMSSAAPFIVAACLLEGSHLFVRGVGAGAGRSGLLTVLEHMGARIAVFNRRTTAGGEPVCDLEVRHSDLVGCEVGPELVPSLIDELPLVALAGCLAHGTTVVHGAAELAVKESNRLESTAALLRAVGGHLRATPDGWEVRGVPRRLDGGRVEAMGDHRIGMLGAVAGLVSRTPVTIEGAAAIDVSFPGFADALESLARR